MGARNRPDVRLELGGRIVGVELTSVTDERVAATYACFSELETELRRVLGARVFSVSVGLDVARALQVAARGGSALGPADLGKAARILKVSFRPRASSDDVDSERLRANLDGLLERKGAKAVDYLAAGRGLDELWLIVISGGPGRALRRHHIELPLSASAFGRVLFHCVSTTRGESTPTFFDLPLRR